MDHGSAAEGEPPTELTWTVHPERRRVRVMLVGELDLATVESAREAVLEPLGGGFAELVIDLSRLEFMDSTGVHLLLEVRAEAQRREVALRIASPQDAVRRVLSVAGLQGSMRIEP